MVKTTGFEAQWKEMDGWNWERIERAVAKEGVAYLHPAPGDRSGEWHPAALAPEDAHRSAPAELSPEDIRPEIRLDVPYDAASSLTPDVVERELYRAAALHAHCQQRGLSMGAARAADGKIWICVKR